LEPGRRNGISGLLTLLEPAGSQTGQFGQVPQMHDLIAPLRFSRRADRKTYMVYLVWSPDELITIF